MKNKIAIILVMLTCTAGAQITYVDISTVTTKALTNTGYITLTNSAPNTNIFYRTVNTNAQVIGDSLPAAFTKLNADVLWLSTAVRTNGGTDGYIALYDDTVAAGFHWGIAPTGGGSTNGIQMLNGTGTNTWLTNATLVLPNISKVLGRSFAFGSNSISASQDYATVSGGYQNSIVGAGANYAYGSFLAG